MFVMHSGAGFDKGGHRDLIPSPLSNRIATVARYSSVGAGKFPRLGERDEARAAEADIATAPVYDRP
jgi:hypothetical protein